MTIAIIYVLCVMVSCYLITKAALRDFGCVTIAGLIAITVISLLPALNILFGLAIYFFGEDKKESFFSKKLF